MRRALPAIALVLVPACGPGPTVEPPREPSPGSASSSSVATSPPVVEVRPPVAADLEGYLKDLPGTGDRLMARIETSLGTLNCELFPDRAPMTVANFVGLATGKKPWRSSGGVQHDKPFYDGLIFHRVIPGFMIQGGDPEGTGRGDPGYRFGSEIDQGLGMTPGMLAMANAGLSTNGSQFFVMEGEKPHLVGKHTIFGKCAELDVVARITHTPASSSRPVEPVTMRISISKG